MEKPSILSVNGKNYEIIKLLGKGKGGYSYLAERDGLLFTIKQIHHEPCDYYTFGDKLESELRDYERLSGIGIRMPRLLDVDREKERILKEYVEGETVAETVEREGEAPSEAVARVKEMCAFLYPAGLNIDYYPTNFILCEGALYYIDYECNSYRDEWNFENWGAKYWKKS